MADKAEVTIMHMIFERFYTFVMSLNNINEMHDSVNQCMELMATVKQKNKMVKKHIKLHHLAICQKLRVAKRKKELCEYVAKIAKLRDVFDSIRGLTDQGNFSGATELYQEFVGNIAAFDGCKIGRYFRRMETALTNNLVEFYRGNFESKLTGYFEAPFNNPQVTHNMFKKSEIDETLAVGYDLTIKAKFDLKGAHERSRDAELLIADLFVNLVKITNVNINTFKTAIVRRYENVNRKLIVEIEAMAQQLKTATGQMNSLIDLAAYYFEVHLTSLQRVLKCIKEIVRETFRNEFLSVAAIDKLVNSRQFTQIESLYSMFGGLLRAFFKFLSGFLEFPKEHQSSLAEFVTIDTFVWSAHKRLKKHVYEKLFPLMRSEADSVNKSLLAKARDLVLDNFHLTELTGFCQEISDSYFRGMHQKNLEGMRLTLQEENWAEIYVSFEVRENVTTVLSENKTLTLSFENMRVVADGQPFFFSKSLAGIFGTIAAYARLGNRFPKYGVMARDACFDCIGFYNLKAYNLIIKGECLNFKVLRRIDTLLMYGIVKECDMLRLAADNLMLDLKPEELTKRQFLNTELKKHKQAILQNIHALLHHDAVEILKSALELNWRQPGFTFYAPSNSACEFVSYLNSIARSFKKFAPLEEYKPYLLYVRQVVEQKYYPPLDSLLAIAPKNAASVREEKRFLTENFERCERGENDANSALNSETDKDG